MKRDWDVIREILIATESLEPNQSLTLSAFDADKAFNISYHVELLDEAGIIYASLSQELGRGPTQFHVHRLTWDGHEFLDSIKSKSTWDKTKSLISEKGGAMSFDVIKGVAVHIGKSALGL
ncbi:DUF2513 domain-containing protein [Colwellia echini]|uniref:DUF2513 domain-containing protein n=1 Tax=Colwellia echini TaxID=1982103 RepID=A0ABY3MSK7_9GAMM|nr:DUF2513 domain-containing protein [Colwellia echini]TYK64171.1 DUF2513 domain-containing protein [Colwellia echini]